MTQWPMNCVHRRQHKPHTVSLPYKRRKWASFSGTGYCGGLARSCTGPSQVPDSPWIVFVLPVSTHAFVSDPFRIVRLHRHKFVVRRHSGVWPTRVMVHPTTPLSCCSLRVEVNGRRRRRISIERVLVGRRWRRRRLPRFGFLHLHTKQGYDTVKLDTFSCLPRPFPFLERCGASACWRHWRRSGERQRRHMRSQFFQNGLMTSIDNSMKLRLNSINSRMSGHWIYLLNWHFFFFKKEEVVHLTLAGKWTLKTCQENSKLLVN